MSRLSSARATLAEAMRGDVLADWRVYDTPPPTLTAPVAWVDVPSVTLARLDARGATTLVASFPLMLVVDGLDRAQVAALDLGAARLWDAIDALPMTEAVSLTPQPFDVGGPRLRGVVLTAEVTLLARTLCPVARLSTLVSP